MALRGLRIAVNTQTPPVRFRRPVGAEGVELETLRRGVDYEWTCGGVTRMVKPLLADWRRRGLARSAVWVSLATEGPRFATMEGLRLSFVNLPPRSREAYARAKEALWAFLNGLPEAPPVPVGPGGLDPATWGELLAYADRSAARLAEEAAQEPFDLLYVHDFQQMGVGSRFPARGVPRVFHLHTPFPASAAPAWARLFARELSAYDRIVVSSTRYAEALRRTGLRVPISAAYPFVDPGALRAPTARDVEALCGRLGIAPGDRVALNVARMDPMKGQDRAILALPALLRRVRDARLVLVGNGSFSSSSKGGLALNKASAWRDHLEALARSRGVADRVTFAGHLDDDDLAAAFQRADAFVFPSLREGFGLAVIEAWLAGKPVVVSPRAGAAELVEPGKNGLLADPDAPLEIALALARVLTGSAEAGALGEAGRRAASRATLGTGSRALERILEAVALAPEGRTP